MKSILWNLLYCCWIYFYLPDLFPGPEDLFPGPEDLFVRLEDLFLEFPDKDLPRRVNFKNRCKADCLDNSELDDLDLDDLDWDLRPWIVGAICASGSSGIISSIGKAVVGVTKLGLASGNCSCCIVFNS